MLKSINSELHEKIESLEKENRKLNENIEHLCRGIDELKKGLMIFTKGVRNSAIFSQDSDRNKKCFM